MKKQTLLLLGICTLLFSCKDKKQVTLPQPVTNEPELITTLVINFTDSADASKKSSASFRDLDGLGGNAPVITDTLRLAKNRTYFASIVLLDETKQPVDSLSKEVLKEAVDHQFFFTHKDVAINTAYLDRDANNLPLGLSTKWITGALGTGSSKITLKHQVGVKNGTEGPGETDIEVTFKLKIVNTL